jgi:hypothetical protein
LIFIDVLLRCITENARNIYLALERGLVCIGVSTDIAPVEGPDHGEHSYPQSIPFLRLETLHDPVRLVQHIVVEMRAQKVLGEQLGRSLKVSSRIALSNDV